MARRPHIFLDSQFSPELAPWIAARFGVRCTHIHRLGLLHRPDGEIFRVAAVPAGIILSKDEDFVMLVRRRGTPPAVIWLRCGNRTTAALQRILAAALTDALRLVAAGEPVIEISDALLPPPKRKRM